MERIVTFGSVDEMRLPKHVAPVLAIAGAAIVWSVWPHARSSPVSPLGAAASGTSVAMVAQTTRTLADQRIEFPLYRNQFTAALTEIKAGGQTGLFKHLVPSFVYVLEGTLTFEVTGHGTRTFSTGQGFAPGINVWHNAENRTNRRVRILTIYAGNDEQRLNLLPDDELDSKLSSPFDFVVGPFSP